jgi:hypothetical protein
MRPKAFVGLILLAISIPASIFSWPAAATTFDPILLGPPQMIEVAVSTNAPDQHTDALVSELDLQSELAKYASARFRDEGLDILVAENGEYQAPPEAIFPQNIVRVRVRVELASAEVRSQTYIVGVISILIRRDSETAWAKRPFTFFTAESEAKVAELARKAAIDQLELSIIEPIVSQAK